MNLHAKNWWILLPISILLQECGSREPGIGKTADSLSLCEMQSTLQFLSHDLLEGRSPGTRGGSLAEEYIQSVFKLLNLEPYGDSYFQTFTLKATKTVDLQLTLAGKKISFGTETAGSNLRETESFDFSGDLVFCGFGIVSEEEAWDDYKDESLEGKIVLLRYNEPQEDPLLFEGSGLTYFGRWTYKIEEAARHGARAVLLIHTAESAGFSWSVVRNSWGVEKFYLPESFENSLEFYGWIREDALSRIIASEGISLTDLYEQSERRDFRSVNLNLSARIAGASRYRETATRNVAAVIPGSDPEFMDQFIVLSAHIDHIGIDPTQSGDRIYNGAIDNASAVAAMVCSGKVLADCRDRLRHSVILLACQAEESWLLGSRVFTESLDPQKIVANINFESTPVWETSRNVFAVGGKYSTLDDAIRDILKKEGLSYSEFSMNEQGFFYRSDQFSFARIGIPSVWISAGEDFIGGVNHLKEYFTNKYHTPDDEYNPDWSLESLKQTVKVAALLVEYLDTHPRPLWKGKRPFPVEKQ